MKRLLPALASALVAVLAGCGTTVPLAQQGTVQSGAGAGAGGGLAGGGVGAGAPSAPAAAGGAAVASSGVPPAGGGTAAGTGAGTAGSGGPGVVAPTGNPAAGAGRSQAPISLGILYAVNDGAQSAGVNNGNNFSLQQVMQGYVASYNASGGIGGRHIDPVYASMHSASNNYESQVQADCATFTQDHHVAAVLSALGYYSENLLTCLARAGVPLITGDWAAPDRTGEQRYPLVDTPTALVTDTRVTDVVTRLDAAGYLQPKNRLGVLIEGCPVDQRVYANTLAPVLHRAGLTVAATYQPRCFQSLQDFGGMASDLQTAVLLFRQKGVDRVLVVSQAAEGNIVLLFQEAADAQHYLPGYALDSTTAPTALALNAPADQLANVHGVGWLPVIDTADLHQAPPTTTGTRCLQRMRQQGVQPKSNTDFYDVYGVCDAFALYDAVLRASGGDASAAAVMRALARVGGGHVAATTVDGREAESGGRVWAGAGRLFGFVGGRFEYTSAAFPL